MKRTTIFLPEALERDLQAYARRERKPVAWVVREAVAQYVVERRPAARVPSFAAIGASDRTDTAERHEQLLWTEPHDDAPVAPSRRTVRKVRKTRRR